MLQDTYFAEDGPEECLVYVARDIASDKISLKNPVNRFWVNNHGIDPGTGRRCATNRGERS